MMNGTTNGGPPKPLKVSDFLCQYLLDHGIDTAFCVTGGTLAHILNSIKQRPEITIYFK